jgi:hypothetical protein
MFRIYGYRAFLVRQMMDIRKRTRRGRTKDFRQLAATDDDDDVLIIILNRGV